MIQANVIVKNVPATDTAAEILKRNIEFYCLTPRGSLPQMRDYGIDYSFLGENANTAKRKLTVAIVSGIREQFGIQISEIDIEEDAEEIGHFTATIIV